jgi:Cu+-exporting ATPase
VDFVAADADEMLVLNRVLAVERRSEHPLAAAIVAYAESRGATAGTATEFEAVAGRGARGTVDDVAVVVGTAPLLRQVGIDIPPQTAAMVERWTAEGRTPVFAAVGGRLAATFGLADTLRTNARAVVEALERDRLRLVMLTGDRRRTGEAIARQASIETVIAEVLPDEKVAAVRRLQAEGRVVAMVGDGLNDAPALAQADVGIAMASGTDIAAEAADVTLMRNDLAGVHSALTLARRTMRTMKQNLFWAFIYNVIGIPIAAGVLYPAAGLLLSPVLASAAMAFSSVSVVANSLRLRRVRIA